MTLFDETHFDAVHLGVARASVDFRGQITLVGSGAGSGVGSGADGGAGNVLILPPFVYLQ